MTTAIAVRERPILFSGEMVRANLREVSPKTQTRRVMKNVPIASDVAACKSIYVSDGFVTGIVERQHPWVWLEDKKGKRILCPYGKPGDRLWVRESFAVFSVDGSEAFVGYKARLPEGKTISDTDGGLNIYALESREHRQWAIKHINGERWMPSIHMPRWASRLTLEIVMVRVERLQDITEEDAVAEGIFQRIVNGRPAGWHWMQYSGFWGDWGYRTAALAYQHLWDSINADRDEGIYAWDRNPWVWVIEYKRLEATHV